MEIPETVVLTLTKDEAAELLEANDAGEYEALYDELIRQLAGGNLHVELSDRQIGQLCHAMSQFRKGGFPARVHRAFRRSLRQFALGEE
jgi:hypothetical protein